MMSNTDVAQTVAFSHPTVIEWRKRFVTEGVETLTKIRLGRGTKPKHKKEKIQQIVEATLHTKPRNATHWSCRTMAKEQGVSASTVRRIWKAYGLQPHRVETFKLSHDPKFVEKLMDITGLYIDPLEKVVVLCMDEPLVSDLHS